MQRDDWVETVDRVLKRETVLFEWELTAKPLPPLLLERRERDWEYETKALFNFKDNKKLSNCAIASVTSYIYLYIYNPLGVRLKTVRFFVLVFFHKLIFNFTTYYKFTFKALFYQNLNKYLIHLQSKSNVSNLKVYN